MLRSSRKQICDVINKQICKNLSKNISFIQSFLQNFFSDKQTSVYDSRDCTSKSQNKSSIFFSKTDLLVIFQSGSNPSNSSDSFHIQYSTQNYSNDHVINATEETTTVLMTSSSEDPIASHVLHPSSGSIRWWHHHVITSSLFQKSKPTCKLQMAVVAGRMPIATKLPNWWRHSSQINRGYSDVIVNFDHRLFCFCLFIFRKASAKADVISSRLF